MEQKVIEAVKNGTPVMYWNDVAEVSNLDGLCVNEDFDLKVVRLRTNPVSGIVVVKPKTVSAWDAYRRGKLALISRVARRPISWAGRYFKVAQRIKTGLDPLVVRAVAKLRVPDVANLPEKTVREKAIKTIATQLMHPPKFKKKR